MRKRNVIPIMFTVNNSTEYQEVKDAYHEECEGILTDYPTKLKDYCEARRLRESKDEESL